MAGFDSGDFKLEDGDLDFTGGDLNITIDSSMEHLDALMQSVTGEYLENVEIGVNLQEYINSPLNHSVIELQRVISANMKADGFAVSNLKVNGNISENNLEIKTAGERTR